MSPTRRQFVTALAVVPGLSVSEAGNPVSEAKPWWYIDSSDPIFDTPVLSKGKQWCCIDDLTHPRPGYMSPPDWIGSGPLIPLRDLDLADPRMSLGAVAQELCSTLQKFAVTLSGAQGAVHSSTFEDYLTYMPNNRKAFALASMHWDAGAKVIDHVCRVPVGLLSDPDWVEVCLGDVLTWWGALLMSESDEAVSSIREEVLELLVFNQKEFRVYDLTREAGANQAVAFADVLREELGRPDLALLVSEIYSYAEWQVENPSEGSRSRLVYLDDLGAIIPWDGGRISYMYPGLSHKVEDLGPFARHLRVYREAIESEAVLVDPDEILDAGSLSDEEVEALTDHLSAARKDPDFQIFVNYDLRSVCPKLQERIHVKLNATEPEIEAAMQQWLLG